MWVRLEKTRATLSLPALRQLPYIFVQMFLKIFSIFFKSVLIRSSPSGVFIRICSENMLQIYKRGPITKCNFNSWITLQYTCSPINMLHIFRNTSEGLPLSLKLIINSLRSLSVKYFATRVNFYFANVLLSMYFSYKKCHF